MKKTSAYARKRRHLGPVVTFNAAAWMNTIALHRSYDEPTDAAGIEGTADTADHCEMLVRMAAQGLIEGSRPTSPEHDFDMLAHALGVTAIRLKQIDPSNDNPALPALIAGTAAVTRAIERYKKSQAWGVDGLGRADLPDAIEIYASVLRASSPAQMSAATEIRMQVLGLRKQ